MDRIWYDEIGVDSRLMTKEQAIIYLKWYLENTGITFYSKPKPQILIPQWAESLYTKQRLAELKFYAKVYSAISDYIAKLK